MSDHGGDQRKPTFWQVIQSVLAGALGVQTNEARKRDFNSGSAMPYIVGGVIFTVLLIVVLVVVVNVVLSNAGV
ncbi:DUF2970 domain-containing protein [Aquisalimonas sp.]|uniref:DUF2970 domain-containing protein n=1 Tax=unclassified Aquisalimonas TaxID=2644645 RepID=UPI0025BD9836|nr:DUF2970 domain-containing protein [Aquisalimonas sp.]